MALFYEELLYTWGCIYYTQIVMHSFTHQTISELKPWLKITISNLEIIQFKNGVCDSLCETRI